MRNIAEPIKLCNVFFPVPGGAPVTRGFGARLELAYARADVVVVYADGSYGL